MGIRLDKAAISQLLQRNQSATPDPSVITCDVFIAGSGPIGATYARTILDSAALPSKEPKIVMAEIGSKDGDIIGGHHKNSIKYQKDIDMFVNVIKGALQPISVPKSETFLPTLGGLGWTPPLPPPDGPPAVQGVVKALVIQGNNPDQRPETNLRASAVTRTVGGMATHWTCACPIPNDEERVQIHQVITKDKMDKLLNDAGTLLNVHFDQYDNSIRHKLVKDGLTKALSQFKDRKFEPIPLAVKRRDDNPDYVTWTGANTILGNRIGQFKLLTETRVTELGLNSETKLVQYALVRDLNTDNDVLIIAKAFVIACGAMPTAQILWRSGLRSPALGHRITEQSMAFCQVILKQELIKSVNTQDVKVKAHMEKYKKDPLPIPFNDPEPQWMIPYSPNFPWHVQVHRDAFSYGDVGPKADPRTVVDLRFFGKGEIQENNYISMHDPPSNGDDWDAGVTDIYGMPQITFHVLRSEADKERDQRMMQDMTNIANYLGSYIPGSEPQFMEPGLAMHVTGTVRIGKDPNTSVADGESRVHGYTNLWVGGNGCLPDATASNPTRTSVAVAIEGARSLAKYIDK
jgi:pyranose oxidase